MTDSAPEYRADTILAVDIGTATTRAMLFDVVEGAYRFVASGEAPTTIGAPYFDASEGMRHALDELQQITGRYMLNDQAQLIVPASPEGHGADSFIATCSAGPALRVALVGLLPEVSLDAARRAAESFYTTIVETISLADRRREERQIDGLFRAKPDLIIMAGGTDDGAKDALLKLADTVGLASYLLLLDIKPSVAFMGNTALQDKVNEGLEPVSNFYRLPNPVPAMDVDGLGPTRTKLSDVIEAVRSAQIGGLRDLAQYSGGHIYPTAMAEAQTIRYLSKSLNTPRGILSVNIGSGSTTLAAAFGGQLSWKVCADYGIGQSVGELLKSPAESITRWLPYEFTEAQLREFLNNKRLHPHTVPDELNDAYLELAVARRALQLALTRARPHWAPRVPPPRPDLLPPMEIIVGGGAVLTRAPRPGHAALVLLDALQPTGFVTALALDMHHTLAALGAIANYNPMALVQGIEGWPFFTLGTAIALSGAVREGQVACSVKITYADKQTATTEVQGGTLEVLPLALGQTASITVRPKAGIDAGWGPGRSRTLEVDGGALGIIIDARGRPIIFPTDPAKRQETVQSWIFKMAGA